MKDNINIVCKGARAAKGGGLKILWYRPSRVRIPSLVERHLGKVEVGGSNPP